MSSTRLIIMLSYFVSSSSASAFFSFSVFFRREAAARTSAVVETRSSIPVFLSVCVSTVDGLSQSFTGRSLWRTFMASLQIFPA